MEMSNEPTAQGEEQDLRRSQPTDLRESERAGESGPTAAGPAASDIGERTIRKAWAWANLSCQLVGGILGQLIADVQGQLATHQDSIDWYQREMETAISGREWHQARLIETQGRLQKLLELQAAVEAATNAQGGDDADFS